VGYRRITVFPPPIPAGIVASRGAMAAYSAIKAPWSTSPGSSRSGGVSGERGSTRSPPGYFPTDLAGHLADAGFARSIREHTPLARTLLPVGRRRVIRTWPKASLTGWPAWR